MVILGVVLGLVYWGCIGCGLFSGFSVASCGNPTVLSELTNMEFAQGIRLNFG